MKRNAKLVTDVLVIGGGGAGCMAAINAAGAGASVLLVEKGVFGHAGCTPMAGFSMCAASGFAEPRDNPDVHFRDTLRGGQFMNDQELVYHYCQEAPDRIQDFISFGGTLSRENGQLHQAMMPGHTYPRAFHYERRTGPMVMSTMASKARRTPGVTVLSEVFVVDLVTSASGPQFAIGLRWSDLQPVAIEARAIVMATGSGAQIFANTTTSIDNTGDGLALLYAAGAELSDMEFVQFYPTTQCHPRLVGPMPKSPAFMRIRAGVRLYNARNEFFMDEMMPDWRFKATRDLLARAIYKEIQEGRGTEHGGVYMDLRHLSPDEIRETFAISNYYRQALKSGVDLTTDAIETTVAAHFFMGGAVISPQCETTLPGIFACGEAASGFHGANRLGGNALSEILVSGRRAGLFAAERAAGMMENPGTSSEVDDRLAAAAGRCARWMRTPGGFKPVSIKRRLKKIMWDHAGVSRNRVSLEKGFTALAALEEDYAAVSVTPGSSFNRELLDAWETDHMLTVSRLVLTAALLREESRGAHYREDFPERNDADWLKNILVRKEGAAMQTRFSPVRCSRLSPEEMQ